MGRKKLDHATRYVGWIGLYPVWITRLFSFVTIGILPLVTGIGARVENWRQLGFATNLATLNANLLLVTICVLGLIAAIFTFLSSRLKSDSDPRRDAPEDFYN